MITKAHAILVGLGLLLMPAQGSALQLTNRDTKDHLLVITETDGGNRLELKASPAQVIDGICLKGCAITMPDGQEYEFDGNEVVSIEDGMIYMEGPFDAADPSDVTEDSAESDAPATDAAN